MRLDHRLGEIALDAVRERRRAELGRRITAAPGQVQRAVLAPEAERARERRLCSRDIVRAPCDVRGGEFNRELQKHSAHALAQAARSAQLRLGIARLAGFGEESRPAQAREAFQCRDAGLRRERAGRAGFAMCHRNIAIERSEPGAQIGE